MPSLWRARRFLVFAARGCGAQARRHGKSIGLARAVGAKRTLHLIERHDHLVAKALVRIRDRWSTNAIAGVALGSPLRLRYRAAARNRPEGARPTTRPWRTYSVVVRRGTTRPSHLPDGRCLPCKDCADHCSGDGADEADRRGDQPGVVVPAFIRPNRKWLARANWKGG